MANRRQACDVPLDLQRSEPDNLAGERSFWLRQATRLAGRRNLAAWLDLFLPLGTALSLVAAGSIVVLRIERASTHAVWIGFVSGLALAAVLSFFLTRRRFLRVPDAFAQLDEVGRLHNRLTAAAAGVGRWPTPRSIAKADRWNWQRLFGPIIIALIALIAAAWTEVPHLKSGPQVTEPPLAWGQIESWLQTLEQSQVIDQAPLEKMREELDEIRQQPSDQWYNNGSLEASDTLRDKADRAIKELLDQMQKNDQAMEAAQKLDKSSPANELKAVNESLQKSLQGLQLGTLPLNREVLNDLKKIDATKLQQINAKQLAQMRDNLKKGIRACEKCLGPSVRPGEQVTTAAGGQGGGEKSAPLTLKENATDLQTHESDAISNDDTSRAALGDVVGVNKQKHDVQKDAPRAPLAAGNINSLGDGGETAWRDSLTPEERAVLQRYFK